MSVPASTSPRWYHSLYWRIAMGTIALIAVMLAAEGALFLWLSESTAGAMPGRSPERMAQSAANEFAAALENDPSLDVKAFLREQYGHFYRTLIVAMRDGTVAANHDDVEEEVLEGLSDFREPRGPRRFQGRGPFMPGLRNPEAPDLRPDRPFPDGLPGGPGPGGNDRGPALGRGGPPDRDGAGNGARGAMPPGFDGRGGDPRGRRPGPLGFEIAPIIVNGSPVGRVAVAPGQPPFARIVRAVGPTMGWVAGGVLLVGGSLVALIVFGPARRRMRQVQAATERLGGGDLTARAPENGGDEVSALARSFNRMADELAQRAQALESSDKARRQLLADVSHELMTPLTAMRGYIETLGMSELQLDTPTRERYMRIVTEETHRLEHIIGDLLDLARLEGGGTTFRREKVTLDDVFERVADRHEREMTERNITLNRTIGTGAEHVTGDADRLEQALQNLVANALRYTPDDGEISLSSERHGDTVKILVRDTGPGIPDEQLALIFDRFYKVDASRKAAAGSGLGLSIVKAIIERHGGSILARTDGGAVFEITLPANA